MQTKVRRKGTVVLDGHTLDRCCSFWPYRPLVRERINTIAVRCKVMPVGARCLRAAHERLALALPHVVQAA